MLKGIADENRKARGDETQNLELVRKANLASITDKLADNLDNKYKGETVDDDESMPLNKTIEPAFGVVYLENDDGSCGKGVDGGKYLNKFEPGTKMTLQNYYTTFYNGKGDSSAMRIAS